MSDHLDLNEFHWLLAIVQGIDVGVVVLDREYRIRVPIRVPAGGRIQYVRIFSIVAVFILVIACINFMNMATAKAATLWSAVAARGWAMPRQKRWHAKGSIPGV